MCELAYPGDGIHNSTEIMEVMYRWQKVLTTMNRSRWTNQISIENPCGFSCGVVWKQGVGYASSVYDLRYLHALIAPQQDLTFLYTYVNAKRTYFLPLGLSNDIQNVSNWCIYSLKRYFSPTKWDRNTICIVFSCLNFLKPVHVQNAHILPQYTPNNDVEQGEILPGLLLMEYHCWHVQFDLSVPPIFVVLWHTPCF